MIGIIWHTEDVLVADLPKDSSALPLLDDFAETTLFLLASEVACKKHLLLPSGFRRVLLRVREALAFCDRFEDLSLIPVLQDW